MRIAGAIYSLKGYRVAIEGEVMNLFDARDRGLVEINRDPHWGCYSYRIIKTGEVVSFFKYLNPCDWSDWYRNAIEEWKCKGQSNEA